MICIFFHQLKYFFLIINRYWVYVRSLSHRNIIQLICWYPKSWFLNLFRHIHQLIELMIKLYYNHIKILAFPFNWAIHHSQLAIHHGSTLFHPTTSTFLCLFCYEAKHDTPLHNFPSLSSKPNNGLALTMNPQSHSTSYAK